ncbi:Tat pathway signal sequence domain protein [Streptomyces ipomoeae 91-03]|uniref:Tat pathway signal sequence domain protein n=1 Tax=Streptomyces ipomoeae 91-03 TaxID=698759 RepID=L1L6P3_9ACTN|nr:Tat pathway signal sequence domain protein [Streptomyces ipomoeae 91-03]
MGHLEFPMDRRRFLTAAALTTGAAALPGAPAGRASAAVPPQVTLPDRGIYDTTAASAWTDGFVTGNGEYGVILYGAPPLEKVILNHHRPHSANTQARVPFLKGPHRDRAAEQLGASPARRSPARTSDQCPATVPRRSRRLSPAPRGGASPGTAGRSARAHRAEAGSG